MTEQVRGCSASCSAWLRLVLKSQLKKLQFVSVGVFDGIGTACLTGQQSPAMEMGFKHGDPGTRWQKTKLHLHRRVLIVASPRWLFPIVVLIVGLSTPLVGLEATDLPVFCRSLFQRSSLMLT